MIYTPKNNFNLRMIETGADFPIYTPENNSNLQLKRTGIGDNGFREKLLAIVACCDEPSYQFYFGFPHNINDVGDSKTITVVGGCPPFKWEVIGNFFSIMYAVTESRSNIITKNPGVEYSDPEYLIVTDSCGNIIGITLILYGDNGDGIIGFMPAPDSDPCSYIAGPVWDSETSAETVGGGENATVAIIDGLGPFQWSVSGTGFSFDNEETEARLNTLRADDTACGTATVIVTDSCERPAIGYVRGTAGVWGNLTWYQSSPPCTAAPVNGCTPLIIVGNLRLWNISWCVKECWKCDQDCAGLTGDPMPDTNPSCGYTTGDGECFVVKKGIQEWLCS